MWRDYDPTLGVIHNVNHYINRNGGNTGFTREFVDNFLMANGLTGSIVFRGVEAYLNYIEGKGDFLMQEPGKILVRALKRTHIFFTYRKIISLLFYKLKAFFQTVLGNIC